MDILTALETSYDRLGLIVSTVEADQLDAPTPLPGWDVRALLNHILGFTAAITDCAHGASMVHETDLDLVQNDPVGALQKVVHESLATWRAPGALEAMIDTPLGHMPGANALALVVMETTIHGTDLARAVAADEAIHEDVAENVLATLSAMPLGAIRAGGQFGPEVAVAANAAAAARALALTGRRP